MPAPPIMTSETNTTFKDNQAVADMRAKIARFGGMMYERHLTDAAGGNISARVGDVVCISPRYAGSLYQWNLNADDVLIVDLQGNILVGSGELSREAKVHLGLHREFSEHGTGVIHAHARNLLVFAAMAKPLPPVLEATRKFGEIPVVGYAPSHTAELAKNVVGAIRGQEARIRKQAAAAIAPWHGLFVMGKDLDAAFDAVERIDNNAYIIMMAHTLGGSPMMADERAALEDAFANFKPE